MKRPAKNESDSSSEEQELLIERWIVGDGDAPRPLSTQRAYRRALRKWLDFLARALGSSEASPTLLWQVTSSLAQGWKEDLLGTRLKPATVNQMLSSVSAFYKDTMASGGAPADFRENPFHSRVLRLRVRAYERVRVLSAAEYRQLMKWLDALPPAKSHLRANALIRTLLHTGWRASELLAMRAGDLHPASLSAAGMRYHCQMPGGREFVDHLPADCVAVLEEYLEAAGRPLETLAPEEYIWAAVRPVNMEGLGVVQDPDEAVCPRQVSRTVRTYLRDAGIPNYASITVPDLRHTHAALLHERGATVDTISKRMRFGRRTSAERLIREVMGAGETDDVSAYFQALRKEPEKKESATSKTQHRTRKESK